MMFHSVMIQSSETQSNIFKHFIVVALCKSILHVVPFMKRRKNRPMEIRVIDRPTCNHIFSLVVKNKCSFKTCVSTIHTIKMVYYIHTTGLLQYLKNTTLTGHCISSYKYFLLSLSLFNIHYSQSIFSSFQLVA